MDGGYGIESSSGFALDHEFGGRDRDEYYSGGGVESDVGAGVVVDMFWGCV